MVQAESSGADERREANLARLRKENTELRRTLAPYVRHRLEEQHRETAAFLAHHAPEPAE